jgi:predicted CopG family antitoxin
MNNLRHITVNEEVYQKLKNLGKAGDSFNDVLTKILAEKGGGSNSN